MKLVDWRYCILMLLLPASLSWAEADGPDWWRVVGVGSDDVLNLRASAGAQAEKLGEIPPGAACVRNLGCQGGLSLQEYTELSADARKRLEKKRPRWCKVEYHGTVGWVSGHYLREGSCEARSAE